MKDSPRILFLVPEDYAALKAKGIQHMILERDENGFFERVITAHPIAHKNQVLHLNEQHRLYEFNLRSYFYPNKKGLLFPFLPIPFFFMIKTLLKIIREEKINVIRATDPYLMGLIAWILHQLTGIPFCISIHSDYELVFKLNPQKGFKQFLRRLASWMPDFVSPKAGCVMPISHYLTRAVSDKVQQECIKVIPHGIAFDFEPENNLREQFHLPPDKKIMSFVGRLSHDNYMFDMLQVMERLSLERQDFMMVFVGGGELEAEMKAWLQSHPHTAPFIKMIGFQPNPIGRSIRYISTISLCLMSGFSLIEAAAAESPMIAYDIEWHSELVTTHDTGFLLQEHDVEGLYKAISYLLDHPEEVKRMGKNARAKAYARHELKNTMSIKRQYYLQLINATDGIK